MKKTAIDILQKREAVRQKTVPRPTQLDFWPERVRGLPNMLARSALFTAAGKTETRLDFRDAVIFSIEGFTLTYNGPELRQDDQDVFLQLVHMMRGVPLGSKLDVTGYAILSRLCWGQGGRDYKRLRESVERMADGRIRIDGTIGGQTLLFKGGLLPSMTRLGNDASSRFSLWLDPSVMSLFGEDAYSLIDWDDRLKLSALAKWLHSFYFTHKEPFAYRVMTLYKLCGSRIRELRSFKFKLQAALEELVAIGFLKAFDIDGELVTVRRNLALQVS